MYSPKSSKDIKEFLDACHFDIEPLYVRTPSGEILECFKLVTMELEDENGNLESVVPVLMTMESDIESSLDIGFDKPELHLPPS